MPNSFIIDFLEASEPFLAGSAIYGLLGKSKNDTTAIITGTAVAAAVFYMKQDKTKYASNSQYEGTILINKNKQQFLPCS